MCKSAAQGPAMPGQQQQQQQRLWQHPRRRGRLGRRGLRFSSTGNGRRSHQSIMPCSSFRHSGRYSFIHSLHSAALFLMVFVVIEAIIRNMHSIFMFVIFPCILLFSSLPSACFCFYCGTLVHPLSFRFLQLPRSLSLLLGPLLMAKTFNMRI